MPLHTRGREKGGEAVIYNLAECNALQRESFRRRADMLLARGATVELTERRRPRSLPQNSYLHLLVQYFALQYGTADTGFVKRYYYKYRCNPDLYVREVEDAFLGRVRVLRSSAELTREEMSLSIDRFRHWASMEAGICLPDAARPEQIAEAMTEVERNRMWIRQ